MNNKLNQWLALIDGEDRRKIEMAKEKNEVIKEAELKISRFSESDQAIYLEISRDIWESDRTTELNCARKEGIEEGRAEVKKKQIKIAKKLLKMKMTIDEICEITELSKEEIEKINKN